MTKFHQGIYKPINPQKYKGNPTNIIYRSSWELKVMRWLDRHPEVLEWSSEEIIVPYVSPIDGKTHRYFIDFYVKFKNGKKYLVEVKPSKHLKPPIKPQSKRGQKKFIRETIEYAKNQAKWEAARKYAQKRGMEFIVLTEKDII